jgi:hypothetical protein
MTLLQAVMGDKESHVRSPDFSSSRLQSQIETDLSVKPDTINLHALSHPEKSNVITAAAMWESSESASSRKVASSIPDHVI